MLVVKGRAGGKEAEGSGGAPMGVVAMVVVQNPPRLVRASQGMGHAAGEDNLVGGRRCGRDDGVISGEEGEEKGFSVGIVAVECLCV